MKLISCLCLIIALAVSVECQQKLINIDYLGVGYDAIQGNPQNDIEDPGFKQSIFPLEYSKNVVTADGRFLIPDNTEAYQTTTCGYQTTSEEIHDESSYRKSLSVDAKVDGSIFLHAFSASAEYKKVHSETYMHNKKYISTAARCNVYRANIKLEAMNQLSADFKRAVNSLPLDDYAPYLHFISIYGTHYVSSVVMGAKATVRSEFEETVWNSLKQEKFDFSGGAQASFWIFNIKFNVKTSSDSEQAQKFDSKRSSYQSMYVGSRPPSDGRWETWINSTGQSPYPIRYSVRPIIELLDRAYFKDSDDNTMRQKKARLNDAIGAWWRCFPDCRIPWNMKLPVLADEVKTDLHGVKVISCSPGTVLLWCGLDNVDTAGSWDEQRYAIPINTTSCECKSSPGHVRCVLWCTNAVYGFTIVKAEKNDRANDTFKVFCPVGRQVLGCQSRRLTPEGRISWRTSNDVSPSSGLTRRDQWPNVNGTACMCYDTLNAECIATCAAGLRNYHIRQSSGSGFVKTTCQPGTMVLGCGSSSVTANQSSSHRAAVVAMTTACRCYDDHEVTCYAVCGLFVAESNYPMTAARLLVPSSSDTSSAAQLGSNAAVSLCVVGLLLALFR